jgi:hypothetical protein
LIHGIDIVEELLVDKVPKLIMKMIQMFGASNTLLKTIVTHGPHCLSGKENKRIPLLIRNSSTIPRTSLWSSPNPNAS